MTWQLDRLHFKGFYLNQFASGDVFLPCRLRGRRSNIYTVLKVLTAQGHKCGPGVLLKMNLGFFHFPECTSSALSWLRLLSLLKTLSCDIRSICLSDLLDSCFFFHIRRALAGKSFLFLTYSHLGFVLVNSDQILVLLFFIDHVIVTIACYRTVSPLHCWSWRKCGQRFSLFAGNRFKKKKSAVA